MHMCTLETRRDERLEDAYITTDVCVCCRIGGRGLRVGGTNNGTFRRGLVGRCRYMYAGLVWVGE